MALELGDAAEEFGVAGGDLVPDAPDVFPGFIADAVEPGVLEGVDFIAIPAAADVHHVAGFEPLVAGDAGDEGAGERPPAHVVPTEGFVDAEEFGFEGEGVAGGIGGGAEGEGEGFHGVAVDAVGAGFGEFTGEGGPVGLGGGAGAAVPGHGGEEDADAAAVEVGDHLANGGEAAGEVAEVVELAAVVDADVGVGVPDEDAVDAAVAFVEIVEVAVDGVATGGGVVEVAVLDHHLGLDEGALGPGEFGAAVLGVVKADADAAFGAPVAGVGEPGGGGGGGGGAVDLRGFEGEAGVLG